jgi:hypothetical protein
MTRPSLTLGLLKPDHNRPTQARHPHKVDSAASAGTLARINRSALKSADGTPTASWQEKRNDASTQVTWRFITADACSKLHSLYPSWWP